MIPAVVPSEARSLMPGGRTSRRNVEGRVARRSAEHIERVQPYNAPVDMVSLLAQADRRLSWLSSSPQPNPRVVIREAGALPRAGVPPFLRSVAKLCVNRRAAAAAN